VSSAHREISVRGEVLRRNFAVEGKTDLVALDPGDFGGSAQVAAFQKHVAFGDFAILDDDLRALLREIADPNALGTFAGNQRPNHQHASAGRAVGRLKLGYSRAARLIEIMEANGIVGPSQGSKPREILIRAEDYPTASGQI